MTEAGRRHKLVVSIINYRTAEMTIACAQSALDDIGEIDAHVVVVDNASGDGSAERLSDWIDSLPANAPITLLRSPTNTGFSGGHNQGVSARAAEAYLLLNSDGYLRSGALSALLEALAARPEAGLVGARLESEDGTVQNSSFRFFSPVSELIRGARLSALTRLLRRWEPTLPAPPDPMLIDWVSFAGVVVRREVFDQIGLLDEGYFMYFEDMDFCLRAKRAGWSVAYAPEARIVHLRGGSAPVKRLAAARRRLPPYFYASRTRFFHRAYGWPGLLAANLLWTTGLCLGSLKRLAGRRRLTIEGEVGDLWINFLAPGGDRRAPEA
jgi:GT2 family glycosyltransferase